MGCTQTLTFILGQQFAQLSAQFAKFSFAVVTTIAYLSTGSGVVVFLIASNSLNS